jgi:hypothetical protein
LSLCSYKLDQSAAAIGINLTRRHMAETGIAITK